MQMSPLETPFRNVPTCFRYRIDQHHFKIFRELADFDKSRIAAVGDSFRTDLAGAVNVGIAPIFVAAGIHADEVGGWPPDPGALSDLAGKWHARPSASVPAFVW